MVAQAEIVAKIDVPEWGGGTLETEEEKNIYVSNKMFTMICLVFVSVAHQYNIHKDLSVSVIEKCMLARQQAQLSNFFESSEDCLIVASQNEEDDKFTVELCNKRAEEVLNVSMVESQLLTKYSMTGFETPILRLKQIDQTGKSKMSSDESVMEREDAPLTEKKKTYSISELIKDKILFVDQQSVLAKLKVQNQ